MVAAKSDKKEGDANGAVDQVGAALEGVLALISEVLPDSLTWPMALGSAHTPHHLGGFASARTITDAARDMVLSDFTFDPSWIGEQALTTGRVALRRLTMGDGGPAKETETPLGVSLAVIGRLQDHLQSLKAASGASES